MARTGTVIALGTAQTLALRVTERGKAVLMVPARVAQAAAPWLFGLLLDRWGAGALWVSAAIGLSVFGALMLLPRSIEIRAPEALPEA